MQSEKEKLSNNVKNYNKENIRCAYPDYNRKSRLGYHNYPRLYELKLQLLSLQHEGGC